jgi:hypothetical protein
VWAGIPSSPNKSLGGLTIGGRYYGAVFGATLAGRIWQSTMNAALAGVPAEAFSGVIDRSYSVGVQHTVPDTSGLTTSIAETVLRQAGFAPVLSSSPVQSTLPAGQVARTSPGAGSSAATGATVTIYVSGGPHAPPGPTPHPTTTVKPTKNPPQGSPTPTPSSSPTTEPSDTPTPEPTETPTDGGGGLMGSHHHRPGSAP